jgi:hypothetical protein
MGAVAEEVNVSVASDLAGGMVALMTLTLCGWMLQQRWMLSARRCRKSSRLVHARSRLGEKRHNRLCVSAEIVELVVTNIEHNLPIDLLIVMHDNVAKTHRSFHTVG